MYKVLILTYYHPALDIGCRNFSYFIYFDNFYDYKILPDMLIQTLCGRYINRELNAVSITVEVHYVFPPCLYHKHQ